MKIPRDKDWVDIVSIILIFLYVIATFLLVYVAYTKTTEIQVSLNHIIDTLQPSEIKIPSNLTLIDPYNNTYQFINGSLVAERIIVPKGNIHINETHFVVVPKEEL